MQVFISYRRSDGYFASALRDALERCNPAAEVFVDVSSIAAGADFETSIERSVAKADVVLLLVGPSWMPERLFEPDDYVRFELLAADRYHKRVVPVLHSGATSMVASALPAELEWLPRRQSITFGSPTDLVSDVARLDAFITLPTPALQDLRNHAWSLYSNDERAALAELVAKAWAEHSGVPTGALADVCRIAAISLIRSGDSEAPGDLWMARSQSTAFRAGASNTFAATLLPFFFRLTMAGRHAEARLVLDEIEALMDEERLDVHPVRMQRRLIHEKRGFSYWSEQRFAEALTSYELARDAAVDDERAHAKVRGAIALCHFAIGDQAWAVRETGDVAELAADRQFRDVERAARANLLAFSEGGPQVAYEVT